MKNIVKALIVTAAAALALTGCAEKKETSVPEESSVSDTSTTSSSSSSSSTTTTTTSSSSKPAATTTSSTTTTTTTTSTTTTTTTTSSSTSAAASSPASSSTTSSVKSSSSSKSSSTKPVEAVKTHDCKKDGHIWGKSYTKTETETTEIVEYHNVAGCGYDFTLADRYFGRKTTDVHWASIFGPGHSYGSTTTTVKTTATKTTTKFFHDCTECGKSEQYDTTETVDPGTNWEFVGYFNQYYNTVWYDINNIPQSVYDAVAKDDADLDDWLAQLAS